MRGTVPHEMEDYQDRLRIATPEGVTVDLVLAGLGSRFTATLIDLTFKGLLILGGILVASLAGDLGIAVSSILTFAIYFGYDVAFEVLANGRTPGKRWTGLRVLRDDGRPVDLLSSAIRNVVRLVDGLPLSYLPAMVSILVTQRNQRLGDLAASTIVVREPRRREAAAAGFAADGAQALPAAAVATAAAPTFGGFALPEGIEVAVPRRAVASAGGTLDVSAVNADDLAAVRGFLDRRADLPAGVRGDLARRIASALAPRVGGATAHLHDEDLIEAVAAAKARTDLSSAAPRIWRAP
ncbi:MAG TPA: RDD family protein [Baekduia sp.]|nr:RDD family protein [Baekduia sp.]